MDTYERHLWAIPRATMGPPSSTTPSSSDTDLLLQTVRRGKGAKAFKAAKLLGFAAYLDVRKSLKLDGIVRAVLKVAATQCSLPFFL